MENDSIEKLVTRCWSAVVAEGSIGDPANVHAELVTRVELPLTVDDVDWMLGELRAKGALP